jgi:hypothetical protein
VVLKHIVVIFPVMIRAKTGEIVRMVNYRNYRIVRKLIHSLDMGDINMFIVPAYGTYKRLSSLYVRKFSIIPNHTSCCLPILSPLKKLALSRFLNRYLSICPMNSSASLTKLPYAISSTVRSFIKINNISAVLAKGSWALATIFLRIMSIIISGCARSVTEFSSSHICNLNSIWDWNYLLAIQTHFRVRIITLESPLPKNPCRRYSTCAAFFHMNKYTVSGGTFQYVG